MKIALRHVEEIPAYARPRPCEICERELPGVGYILVLKQLADEEPSVDFVICDVCSAKIAIQINRHLFVGERAPPSPDQNGGGRS